MIKKFIAVGSICMALGAISGYLISESTTTNRQNVVLNRLETLLRQGRVAITN